MNNRMIFRVLSLSLLTEAALMLPSLLIAFFHKESVTGFVYTILVLLLVGLALRYFKPITTVIYAREGFLIVALTWIAMSAFGALPFVIDGAIPHFVDAFFETVSGFTTTGASILRDVEVVGYGLLFWRSFTHWIGGMGVLVFVMAVLPLADDRNMHIMRAEVPGPVKGKLVPRARNTALILYGIYVFMTVVEILLLVAGGMPVYDAVVHSFGTAGTGGFGIKNNSIAYYNSAYIDVVMGVFMILFGINFNLYYLLLLGSVRRFFKSEELRWFLAVIGVAIAAISINIHSIYGWDSVRYALFQVSSIITTTGFSTANFDQWPELSRFLLVFLMILGACAGSTGGGIKVSRFVILFKTAVSEIKHMTHPRAVTLVRLEGKPVTTSVIHNTLIFFLLYMLLLMFSVLTIAIFDEADFTSAVTAVIACLGNIGPGLGVVGPAGNYASFSYASKILLSFDMLLGRLEIFPIILLLLPSSWKKN